MAQTRRRSSAGVGLAVFLLLGALVVVGLYAGDRYVLGRTEREAAAQLQTQLGTPQPPSVQVAGWPFLTQVAARHVRSVRVIADDVGTASSGGGTSVPVAHTDLVLTDVTSPDWFQTMTAAQVAGTALVAYGNVGLLSNVPLAYAGDGRLRADTSATVFGAQIHAQITGTPQLDVRAQTITLGDAKVQVGGTTLPDVVSDALLRAVLKPIPVAGLPFGLTLSSVAAEDDGLHVGLEGTDVELRR